MSLTAEIKALLDGVGTLTAVYRVGYVPDDAAFPYASILDPVANAPAMHGDARTLARRRLSQVDLWMDETEDSDALVEATIAALDGQPVEGWGRLLVQDASLVDSGEDGVVHHVLTLSSARA